MSDIYNLNPENPRRLTVDKIISFIKNNINKPKDINSITVIPGDSWGVARTEDSKSSNPDVIIFPEEQLLNLDEDVAIGQLFLEIGILNNPIYSQIDSLKTWCSQNDIPESLVLPLINSIHEVSVNKNTLDSVITDNDRRVLLNRFKKMYETTLDIEKLISETKNYHPYRQIVDLCFIFLLTEVDLISKDKFQELLSNCNQSVKEIFNSSLAGELKESLYYTSREKEVFTKSLWERFKPLLEISDGDIKIDSRDIYTDLKDKENDNHEDEKIEVSLDQESQLTAEEREKLEKSNELVNKLLNDLLKELNEKNPNFDPDKTRTNEEILQEAKDALDKLNSDSPNEFSELSDEEKNSLKKLAEDIKDLIEGKEQDKSTDSSDSDGKEGESEDGESSSEKEDLLRLNISEIGIDESRLSESQKLELRRVREFANNTSIVFKKLMKILMIRYQRKNKNFTAEMAEKMVSNLYDLPVFTIYGPEAASEYLQTRSEIWDDEVGENFLLSFNFSKPIARFRHRGGSSEDSIKIPEGMVEWGHFYEMLLPMVYKEWESAEKNGLLLSRLNSPEQHDAKSYYFLWRSYNSEDIEETPDDENEDDGSESDEPEGPEPKDILEVLEEEVTKLNQELDSITSLLSEFEISDSDRDEINKIISEYKNKLNLLSEFLPTLVYEDSPGNQEKIFKALLNLKTGLEEDLTKILKKIEPLQEELPFESSNPFQISTIAMSQEIRPESMSPSNGNRMAVHATKVIFMQMSVSRFIDLIVNPPEQPDDPDGGRGKDRNPKPSNPKKPKKKPKKTKSKKGPNVEEIKKTLGKGRAPEGDSAGEGVRRFKDIFDKNPGLKSAMERRASARPHASSESGYRPKDMSKDSKVQERLAQLKKSKQELDRNQAELLRELIKRSRKEREEALGKLTGLQGETLEAYARYKEEMDEFIEELLAFFIRKFKLDQTFIYQRNLPRGQLQRNFQIEGFVGGNKNRPVIPENSFERKIQPTRPRLIWNIVIDNSGSTSGDTIEYEKMVAIALVEVAKELGIDIQVTTFANSGDGRVYSHLKEFDEDNYTEYLSNIVRLTAAAGTPDVQTLRGVCKSVRSYSEETGIEKCFVYFMTDGQSEDSVGLAQVINDNNSDMVITGIGLGEVGAREIHNWGSSAVEIPDIRKIGAVLIREIEKQVDRNFDDV